MIIMDGIESDCFDVCESINGFNIQPCTAPDALTTKH